MSSDIQLKHGDCLPILTTFSDQSVQLIYLDPPFFTQKQHRLHTKDRQQEFTFQDSWKSQEDYFQFLTLRVQEMHRILKNEGSIFFHCDKNATHIVRILLDNIFGPKQFRAEIIWHYRRWSNPQKSLLSSHQTIYYYTKSDQYLFNPQWEEYSPSTNIDQLLQRRTRDEFQKTHYKRDEQGEIIYQGNKKGVPLRDVWDIPYLNPKAQERTGYPTQKPILLLKRILEMSTQPQDLVLDPFCGSGTTLLAAKILSRQAIGIDISEEALHLTERRLKNPVESPSRVFQKGRESYRQTSVEVATLLQGIDCVPVQRNKGIDALLKESFQEAPVPIRVQRPFETLQEAVQKLFEAGKSKKAQKMWLIVHTLDPQIELPPEIFLLPMPALLMQQAQKKE